MLLALILATQVSLPADVCLAFGKAPGEICRVYDGPTTVWSVKDGPPAPLPASQADAQANHLLAIGLAGSADMLSTAWWKYRCTTCYEGNKAAVNADALFALKVGGMTAVGFGTWKLERSGHHGWAKALRWGYVGVTSAIVVNNSIRAIRRK